MFFEVSSLTYHSPITIELLTYRGLLGTRKYCPVASVIDQEVESLRWLAHVPAGSQRPPRAQRPPEPLLSPSRVALGSWRTCGRRNGRRRSRRLVDRLLVTGKHPLKDQPLDSPRREPVGERDELVSNPHNHARPTAQQGLDADRRDRPRLHHQQPKGPGVALMGHVDECGGGSAGSNHRHDDPMWREFIVERFTK